MSSTGTAVRPFLTHAVGPHATLHLRRQHKPQVGATFLQPPLDQILGAN